MYRDATLYKDAIFYWDAIIILIKCKILVVLTKSLEAHGQGNGKIINLNICISDIAKIG